MPKPPLLPLLRAGAFLLASAVLLYCPRPKKQAAIPLEEGFWVVDLRQSGQGALRAGQRATGPVEGQKRPPCDPDIEVEVAKACWWPHLKRPPCPKPLYEGNGLCLGPVMAAKRVPTSIEP